MSPEPEDKFTVVAVRVKFPERVMVPEPPALRTSIATLTLLSISMEPLLEVERLSVLVAPAEKSDRFKLPTFWM